MLTVREREMNRLYNIQEYGIDTEHFTIYIQGEEANPYDDCPDPGVDYRMANKLIKNLDVLTASDSERPIIISMKTTGGDWHEGMAMYDAILATPNPISIIAYTFAESMGSVILQAANKRIMMPHSIFMFHEGHENFAGTRKEIRSEEAVSKLLEEEMLQIYIDCLKRSQGKAKNWSRKRIREWLVEQMNEKENVYLTAEDAVKIGFADEIFSSWDTVTRYTKEQLSLK